MEDDSRSRKILNKIQAEYDEQRTSVGGMSPSEKKSLMIMIVVAVIITALMMWVF